MTSGVPQNFDAAFVAGINDLIEKVKAIDVHANPNEEFPVVPEEKNFEDYCKWLDDVRELFNTDDLKQHLPYDFFFAEKLRVPRSKHFKSPVVGRLPEVDPNEFRVKLHNAIATQISALLQIKDDYGKKMKQIVIHIEHDDTIWRDDRNKYYHRSPRKLGKQSKRIRLIKAVVRKKGRISAKELMKKLDYGEISTLSREKNMFNDKLKERLELSQDVILGGEHTQNSGYIINPAYKVVIEKKRG